MATDLAGYLLGGLEPAERRRIEQQLLDDPDLREELERLRQATLILAADSNPEPPLGLAQRTMNLVVDQRGHGLPEAPAVPLGQRGSRRSWRRADVVVAACLLICFGALIPPAVIGMQRRAQIVTCSDNMHKIGVGLTSYSDLHDPPGRLPNPAREKEPCNVAGFVLPILLEAGVAQDVNLRCPGDSIPPPFVACASELRDLPDDEFNRRAPYLLGSYAYSLGYRTANQILSPELGDFPLPVLADRPPSDPAGLDLYLNSPNHRGAGQNVLFTDGHVEFIAARRRLGDDLYLNDNGRQEPGVGPRDTVLAPSATSYHYPTR
jgi:prepilin-type processing-associated H-X9-DG protein